MVTPSNVVIEEFNEELGGAKEVRLDDVVGIDKEKKIMGLGNEQHELEVKVEVSDDDFYDSEFKLDDDDDDILFGKSIYPDFEEGGGEVRGDTSTSVDDLGIGITVEYIILGEIEGDDINDKVDLSDDLCSVEVSNHEGIDDPVFYVGMLFFNKKILKNAIKNASFKYSVSIHIKKR